MNNRGSCLLLLSVSWLTVPANTDVFAIREARPHLWVLSTTRQISQGGVDLIEERWNAETRTLSGRSAVVAGDPYVLTVHLPGASRIESADFGGNKAEFDNRAEVATIRIKPSTTGTVAWKVRFGQHLRPLRPALRSLPHAGHGMFFKDEKGRSWSTYFGSDRGAPWQERPGVLPIAFDADGRVRPARIIR